MKVQKELLLSLLDLIKPVVQAGTVINFLDGQILVNLGQTIQLNVKIIEELKVQLDLNCAVGFKEFSKAVEKIPSKEFDIDKVENAIVISHKKIKYNLETYPVNLAVKDLAAFTTEYKLTEAELKYFNVLSGIGSQSSNISIQGIHFKNDYMEATDGVKCVRIKIPQLIVKPFLIYSEVIKWFSKIKYKKSECTIKLSDSEIMFIINDYVTLTSALLVEPSYPDISIIIFNEKYKEVFFNFDCLAMFDRAQVVFSQDGGIFEINGTTDKIAVNAKSNFGDFNEEVETTDNSFNFDFRINPSLFAYAIDLFSDLTGINYHITDNVIKLVKDNIIYCQAFMRKS